MRVLVTGGAGFIGSHVCDSLLDGGHDVICVDNFLTGKHRNIAHLRSAPGFSVLEGDVASVPLPAVDRILHLASPASPVDYDRLPLETIRANTIGTWHLLEHAASLGVPFFFASTSEVYGDPLVHPQPETYWGNVDPVGPRSCYDESKRLAEALIMSFRRARGVRANFVRIFNTYGPRMRPDDGRAVPQLISAALRGEALAVHGDGSQTRSFCYVDDLVQGMLHVALDDEIDGEIFNVGNPHEVTIRELSAVVKEVTESHSEVEFVARPAGDPERRRPDITKIAGRYGWRPTISLHDGLRRTVAAFREVLSAPA